nr:unnamed protein product [Callosobruchus chinensis]
MRCFNCQAIGHSALNCKKEKICPCGISAHDGTPCQEPKKCVNCGGAHSAAYKGCPKYKTEASIQKIKATENISYIEAKRKVVVNTPSSNVTYGNVAATMS